VRGLFEKVADRVYSTEPASSLLLGYPQDGHVSTYYPDSPDITKNEIERAHNAVSGAYYAENTRLQKVSDKEFRLLVASSSTSMPEKSEFDMGNGQTLKIVLGDHSKEMAGIAEECLAAAHTGLNENEKSMFSEYAKSFTTGSINSHKDAQRFWIKDKGPRVECNLGFVETYRDPHGIRGEWEGFVAMVNQEQTRKFGQMVARAGEFIPRLPWSTEFEKDEFLKPDFTSLEVLSFCTSGIPAGINIPNYDDLRQTFGFKNVSLGNVLSAKAPNEPITFIRQADKKLYEDHKGPAFEVQVGIHELLGHGTGKLLQETEKGKYNFDINKPPKSPITGEPVNTWYKPDETWGSVFGSIAASYEECRAECVAMYLGGELDLLEIFGYGKDTEKRAEDVLYIEYLQMARAGLLALEYWDPEYKKWGQGHMQARFSILKTMLASGIVKLVSNKADHDDLVISLDRSKIRSHGIPAVGDYLQKLHVYKSTADFEGGKKLYEDMTTVGEDMAKYREVVMRKKLPRKQFVQANTVLEGGGVTLKEYEPTLEGLVRSYVEREG